jgi:hypothetical protein
MEAVIRLHSLRPTRSPFYFSPPLSPDHVDAVCSICNDLFSDDPSVLDTSIRDLAGEAESLKFRLVPFLSPQHLNRLITLLPNPLYQFDSLRILSWLATDGELVAASLVAGGLLTSEGLPALVQRASPRTVIYAVKIVGNSSLVSREFRDAAFDAGLFQQIAALNYMDAKARGWCLQSAFEQWPYPSDLVDDLLPPLLHLSLSPNVDVNSAATKVLSRLVDLDISAYRPIVGEFRFVTRLVDIITCETMPKKERAAAVLADCCLGGDELISQMMFCDTLHAVVDQILKRPSDGFLLQSLALVDNWIHSTESYDEPLFDAFCRGFWNVFFDGAVFRLKVVAARVISRLVVLVDFKRFLEVMTPQVAAAMVGLLLIDEEVAEKFLFPTFRAMFEHGQPELLNEFAKLVAAEIERGDGYDSLFFSENDEIRYNARMLKASVARQLGINSDDE